MRHGVLKEHQVHGGVELVVAVQGVGEDLVEAGPLQDRHVFGLTDALGKVAIDEGFAEHLALGDVVKALLDDVFLHLLKVLDVLGVSQLVQVDTVSLVTPQPAQICRCT